MEIISLVMYRSALGVRTISPNLTSPRRQGRCLYFDYRFTFSPLFCYCLLIQIVPGFILTYTYIKRVFGINLIAGITWKTKHNIPSKNKIIFKMSKTVCQCNVVRWHFTQSIHIQLLTQLQDNPRTPCVHPRDDSLCPPGTNIQRTVQDITNMKIYRLWVRYAMDKHCDRYLYL